MSDIKKQILTLLKQRHHSHKVALEQEKDPRSKHAIDLIARIREDSRLMELIDSPPEEKPSKDLEEEISRTYHDGSVTDTDNIDHVSYENIARHFAEWGAKHKDSLHIPETCKENQDSFTDEPKEMSVDDAMKYIDEKIAKTRASKSWEGVDVDKFMDEIRGREPNDLEEAADEYAISLTPCDQQEELNYFNSFIAGAKWMESHMPMPEDTVIFMKGVEEGRRLEREDRNDDNLPRFYGD